MTLTRLTLLALTALVVLTVWAACTPDTEPNEPGPLPEAQALIDRAIAIHGGDHLDRALVTFDFRDRHFTIRREDGLFRYERRYTDSTGAVREVLSNDSLYREVDGRRVDLTEDQLLSVERGVNSVVYFALLPYRLNDPAVQKRYLGATTIDGEPYHEIEVTFAQEGGGQDYQDRFVYWIHGERYTMDYLAYDFIEDEGGTRFRKAINVREIGGVRVADYQNYVSDSLAAPGDPIERYDEFLGTDALELLSEINLENIQIRPL